MKLPFQVEAVIFREQPQSGVSDSTLAVKAFELLMLHRTPENGGFWQLLTGGVEDYDADNEAAIIREIGEELSIGPENIVGIFSLDYQFKFNNDKGIELTEDAYGVEVDPTVKIALNDEHDDSRWCSVDEALSLLKWPENKEVVVILSGRLSSRSNK